MIAALAWTAGSAALLAAARLVHTRVRGFLPEDAPTPGRKRHPHPTPMAGALPGMLATIVLATSGMPWAAAGTAIAAVLGLWDDFGKDRSDRGGVPWQWKAVVLLAAAVFAAAEIVPRFDGGGTVAWLTVVVALFVLTNAANFLDNQDGVATALGATALLVTGGGDLAAPATILGGVWIAFLPFNWPRARLFLGDGGSFPLGCCAATFALRSATSTTGIDALQALAPVCVFAVDFTQVVTARLVLGYAPWIGDRRHLTHVLLARGVPRVALAPLLVVVTLLVVALARA